MNRAAPRTPLRSRPRRRPRNHRPSRHPPNSRPARFESRRGSPKPDNRHSHQRTAHGLSTWFAKSALRLRAKTSEHSTHPHRPDPHRILHRKDGVTRSCPVEGSSGTRWKTAGSRVLEDCINDRLEPDRCQRMSYSCERRTRQSTGHGWSCRMTGVQQMRRSLYNHAAPRRLRVAGAPMSAWLAPGVRAVA
jgi:hypothetical protein